MEKIITNYLIEHLEENKEKINWHYFVILEEEFIEEICLIYGIEKPIVIKMLNNILCSNLVDASVIFIYKHNKDITLETTEHISRKHVNWFHDLTVLLHKLQKEQEKIHRYDKATIYRGVKRYLTNNLNEYGRFD